MTTNQAFKQYLVELRQSWKPQCKEFTGTGYHGSIKGDLIEATLYFDVYRKEWTTEMQAFEGYVMSKINEIIIKQFNSNNMSKQYVVVRYPLDEQGYVIPQNNVIFNDYNKAVAVFNDQCVKEGLLPVSMPKAPAALRQETSAEAIELWMVNRPDMY